MTQQIRPDNPWSGKMYVQNLHYSIRRAIEKTLIQHKMFPFDGTYDEDADLDYPINACQELWHSQCSVMESYTPDSPGWCGMIITIVWGFATAFTIVGVDRELNVWVQNFCEGKLVDEGESE